MKRFTDTEKWQPWFRKLSASYKLLWFFLCDRCDNAGVWERDDEVARLYVSSDLDFENFLQEINKDKERIRLLKNSTKWWLLDFVKFQITTLKKYDQNGKINRVHIPYYKDLERHGLDSSFFENDCNRASAEPLERLQRQDKDRIQEKEEGGSRGKQNFEKFWDAYPKKRSKGQAEKAWRAIKPDEQLQDRILGALERAKTSAEWRKNAGEFIPYPATWLNAKGWEDVLVTVTSPSRQEQKPNSGCGGCNGSGYLEPGKKCWCWK